MVTNNSINARQAGLVRYDGTSTFDGVTVTQHDLLIGAASNGITSVAPSATVGVPVISQGAAADPAFGTAVVAGGGTGLTSTTAYGVLLGGTTTTANFQNAGAGTAGQLLVSGGVAAVPTWKNFVTNVQVITVSGTYTPTSGTKYAVVEIVGGGGGAGGCAAGAANNAATGGAGSGASSRGVFSAATIGASQTVTIGAGGVGGAAGAANVGTDGGQTSFGALLTAGGGGHTVGGNSIATDEQVVGGAGGSAGAGGFLNIAGDAGDLGIILASATAGKCSGGAGGDSLLGAGGSVVIPGAATDANGQDASGYGGGGGGAASAGGAAGAKGGNGSPGVCIVTEYILQ